MLKIGYFNFWDGFDNEEFKLHFGNALLKNGIDYEICDFCAEECDIVFYSCFGENEIFSRINGHPTLVYYSGESSKLSWANQSSRSYCDLSMTFDFDSDTNLYLPYWQVSFDTYKECYSTMRRNFQDKTRFCSFMYRHGSREFDGSAIRSDLFFKMNELYKKVDSLGPWCNNTPEIHIPNFGKDNKETQKIINQYKYSICFENNSSDGNENYITEKLLNGYVFGTVPIYSGRAKTR